MGSEEYLVDVQIPLELKEKFFRLQMENWWLKKKSDGAISLFLLLDSSGRIVEADEKWLHHLQYDTAEILNQEVFAYLHPSHSLRFKEKYSRYIQHGEVNDLYLLLLKKDGSTLPAFLSGRLHQYKKGEEGRFHCFFEVKQERSFLGSTSEPEHSPFIELATASNTVFYRIALPEYTYEYISPSAETFFGYPPRAFYENPLLLQDLIYPEDIRDLQLCWEKVLQGSDQQVVEYRIIAGEDQLKWVQQKFILVKNGDADVAIEGMIIDITERRQTEEKLLEFRNRLNQVQKMGRVGCWEYYPSSNTFWGSEVAKQLFGLETSDGIFTREEVEECMPEKERVRQAMEDLLEKDLAYNLEFEVVPQNDHSQRRIIRSKAELIRDDKGGAVKVFGIIEDISRWRQFEREKHFLESQLKQAQKMEPIGTLAGGIAHDFNNILSAVLGFTDISLRSVEEGSELEEDLKQVYAAGLRAKELVQQILTFARKSDEELKPVRVDLLVKEVVKFLRSTIPTNIEIHANIRSSELILANPVKIHQLIMNLCTNAAYAIDGAGKINILLDDVVLDDDNLPKYHNMKPGMYQRLNISDTGMGIGPDIIDSIFEPFFTTKDIHEGTGLGLTMVHTIVKECGGDISVQSILGEGSSFTILLPVVGELSPKNIDQVKAPLPGGKERILVVDDEVPICRVLFKILGGAGYEVTTLLEGKKALHHVAEQPDYFDLVITDMAMPKMTGDVLTQKILEICPDLPVIIATGYSRRMSDPKAEELGAKAYLPKPFEKDLLIKTVRRVLDDVLEKKSSS